MNEKTVKINMYGKHICSINESFIKKLRENLNVTNYSSWIRNKAYEDFNLKISNSDDIEKLKEIIYDNLYDNIGDWIRDKIRITIKDISNPFRKDKATKLATDKTILQYSITHTVKNNDCFEKNKIFLLSLLTDKKALLLNSEEDIENVVLNTMTHLLSININCSNVILKEKIDDYYIDKNILLFSIENKFYCIPLSNQYKKNNYTLIDINKITSIHQLQYLYHDYIGNLSDISLPAKLTFANLKKLINQINTLLDI